MKPLPKTRYITENQYGIRSWTADGMHFRALHNILVRLKVTR